jgi:preprotein translocase subunit SecD
MKHKILLLFILSITCFYSCKKTKESLSDVPEALAEDSKKIADQSKQELEKNKKNVIDKTKKMIAPAVEKLHETLPKLNNTQVSKIMVEYAQLVSQLFATKINESTDSTEIQQKVAQKFKELLTVSQTLDEPEKQKITEWLNKLPKLTGSVDFH